MRTISAILVGKTIKKISQTLRVGGGSAAPGLYALRIEPELVSKLASQISTNIIITGTNGKTTTTRMLSQILGEVIRNATGSNLERGVASTLLSQANLRGKISTKTAIWELDEAAFNLLAPKLNPQVVVFLNVFRDQLDRYGEIDSVVTKWNQTVKSLPKETVLLINGDDLKLMSLKKAFAGKTLIFGLKEGKIRGEAGQGAESLDFEVSKIQLKGLKGSDFKLTFDHQDFKISLPTPGVYQIYNSLAALSAAWVLGQDLQKAAQNLKDFSPAFGRVEQVRLGKNQAYIFLIKNPIGASQVFQTLSGELNSKDRILAALNDKLADGTDVSWIWDVDFELIKSPSRARPRDPKIICSGTRAEDLALRFKYAGFEPKLIKVEPSLQNALRQAQKGLKGRLFILPTYTALLEIQRLLAKSGIKPHYWQEN